MLPREKRKKKKNKESFTCINSQWRGPEASLDETSGSIVSTPPNSATLLSPVPSLSWLLNSIPWTHILSHVCLWNFSIYLDMAPGNWSSPGIFQISMFVFASKWTELFNLSVCCFPTELGSFSSRCEASDLGNWVSVNVQNPRSPGFFFKSRTYAWKITRRYLGDKKYMETRPTLQEKVPLSSLGPGHLWVQLLPVRVHSDFWYSGLKETQTLPRCQSVASL